MQNQGDIQWSSCSGNGMKVTKKKLNIELLRDPEIPLLDIHPQRTESGIPKSHLLAHVRSSIICNSQKGEATRVRGQRGG